MKKSREQINFRYNLGIYLEFLKKYKPILFVILLMLLIMESKGVLDKFLFKILIDKGTEFSSGTIAYSGFIGILIIMAAIFAVTSVISAFSRWFNVHLLNRMEANMIFDLKKKFFSHILNLDYNFHITHKTGGMISRIIRGGSAMETMTDALVFNFFSIIIELTIITFSLIYLDWVSAALIWITVVFFVSYSFYMQRLQEPYSLRQNKSEDTEKANIGDIFANIDSIKHFGKEKLIEGKYEKFSEETKKAQVNNWDYYRWMISGQNIIISLGTFLIIFFPLMRFLNGDITLGTLSFVYTIYLSLMNSMFGFIHGIRGFYRAMGDFQDLFDYGKIEKVVQDKPGAKELKVSQGEVEFRNVSFHYGRKKAFNLDKFSLKIKKNEKIALVGHSGCGKTSLIRLLYRLYDVDSGEILIDGKNIKEFKQESLREELSIVPQECVLFDDTIFNNIKFSNPKASRQEVFDAIKFAQLDRLIKNLPKKENTIVGERGVKLSGGEKQRVSIARAILANKRILILDEATSALDSETENEIQKNLHNLLEGRTSIIIAHRLSTIMSADRIIVMKSGKIIQEGKHSQLINQPGEYKKLWNLQKGGYIKE